ncbi:MAG: DUF177 domain-containing protein [Candidatus Zixiibacteriota bacterium]
MILDLRNIDEFPAHITLQTPVSELDVVFDGLTVAGLADVTIDIIRSEHIYYCQGTIECDGHLICSRCAEEYPVRFRGEIDFSIQEADEGSIDPDEVPENELLVAPGTQEIEISQPIREALLLEVPLKPLCSEDCLGVCPICGGNKNETPCDCKVVTEDSRWDALRALKAKMNSDN